MHPRIFYSLSRKSLVKPSKVFNTIVKFENALKESPLKMLTHLFYYIADKPLAKDEL